MDEYFSEDIEDDNAEETVEDTVVISIYPLTVK